MEEKGELIPSNAKKIRRLKKLAWEHDREFEEHHVEVFNFIAAEDTCTAALEIEEDAFDEHMERVTEFIELLEQVEDLVGNRACDASHIRQGRW